MKVTLLFLLIVFGFHTQSFCQDTLILNERNNVLNVSIADHFTLYESEYDIQAVQFKTLNKNQFISKKLINPIENLDFTSSTYFINFVVINQTNEFKDLLLETARPITNGVSLFNLKDGKILFSGDGIPFKLKAISSNKSVLPLKLAPHSTNEYILELSSDGEIISLPMIFWERQLFEQKDRSQQFFIGIFYGIFLFVIIIYLTFYALLKDKLFLLYTLYVLCSGLLQFGLDGYMHQYLFTSGNYLTQHLILIIAGFTSILALLYATLYLDLKGRIGKMTKAFSLFVLIAILFSLIPGKIYEMSFPLINGLSLLAIVFLLIITIRIRRNNPKISRLFIVGLSSLLIGAVIFILGNFSIINIPSITQNSLKAGTLIEIICLSILMAGKYKTLQDEKEQAQLQLLQELEEKNKTVLETNIRLEKEVEDRTKEIENQRKLLKEKNDHFISSITYAERIQSAVLANSQKFKSILPESFVIFRPKDIVSGDFYWIEQIEPSELWPEGLIIYATADCTGHGVPGAFVSIICNNLLKLVNTDKNVQSPGQALDVLNIEINKTLNSKYSDKQIRDGMDVALCVINKHDQTLQFSGAKNGVYILRNGAIIELKGDRRAIGYSDEEEQAGYTTQIVSLEKGDLIYTLSDGFVDQFGGPNQKKFMSKQLKELLISVAHEPMDIQKESIQQAFEDWRGELDQIDDVLLIGVQIN